MVISAPGAEDRVYRFGYKDSGSVPSIYTTAVDHWGFCNGREPHAEWAQTGLLASVTTPQGVRTTFTYEGNAAGFRDSTKDKPHRDYLHPVGGVRVSLAESVDVRTGKRVRRYYTYGLTKPEEEGYEPVWGGGAVKHLVTQRDYWSRLVVVDGDPATHITWEESVTGDDGSQQRTLYYYEVDSHRFEDVLAWDDSDPAGSVRELLSSGITESNKSLVRPEPYRPHEPSDDFTPGASHRMEGALLRTDYYRDGALVARHENEWEEKKFWDAQRVYTSFVRPVAGERPGSFPPVRLHPGRAHLPHAVRDAGAALPPLRHSH